MSEREKAALAFGTMTVPRQERLYFYQRERSFHMELLIDHVSKRFKDKKAVNQFNKISVWDYFENVYKQVKKTFERILGCNYICLRYSRSVFVYNAICIL